MLFNARRRPLPGLLKLMLSLLFLAFFCVAIAAATTTTYQNFTESEPIMNRLLRWQSHFKLPTFVILGSPTSIGKSAFLSNIAGFPIERNNETKSIIASVPMFFEFRDARIGGEYCRVNGKNVSLGEVSDVLRNFNKETLAKYDHTEVYIEISQPYLPNLNIFDVAAADDNATLIDAAFMKCLRCSNSMVVIFDNYSDHLVQKSALSTVDPNWPVTVISDVPHETHENDTSNYFGSIYQGNLIEFHLPEPELAFTVPCNNSENYAMLSNTTCGLARHLELLSLQSVKNQLLLFKERLNSAVLETQNTLAEYSVEESALAVYERDLYWNFTNKFSHNWHKVINGKFKPQAKKQNLFFFDTSTTLEKTERNLFTTLKGEYEVVKKVSRSSLIEACIQNNTCGMFNQSTVAEVSGQRVVARVVNLFQSVAINAPMEAKMSNQELENCIESGAVSQIVNFEISDALTVQQGLNCLVKESIVELKELMEWLLRHFYFLVRKQFRDAIVITLHQEDGEFASLRNNKAYVEFIEEKFVHDVLQPIAQRINATLTDSIADYGFRSNINDLDWFTGHIYPQLASDQDILQVTRNYSNSYFAAIKYLMVDRVKRTYRHHYLNLLENGMMEFVHATLKRLSTLSSQEMNHYFPTTSRQHLMRNIGISNQRLLELKNLVETSERYLSVVK